MVYYHRTVKCPNCGRTAEKTRTVNSKELIGSPFRICPHCNLVYFDSAYHEKAIEVFNDKGGELSFGVVFWLLLSNGLVLLHIYTAIKEGSMDSLWIPFLAFLFIAFIFDFGLVRYIRNRRHAAEYHQKMVDILEGRTKNQTDELAASMKRLSSVDYLDSLRAHGVSVPDYFYERLRNTNPESCFQFSNPAMNTDNSMIRQFGEDEESDNWQETREIVFCRKCGDRIPSDSVFCPKCGERIIKL